MNTYDERTRDELIAIATERDETIEGLNMQLQKAWNNEAALQQQTVRLRGEIDWLKGLVEHLAVVSANVTETFIKRTTDV